MIKQSTESTEGAAGADSRGPRFEDGDDVVLREHPEAQVFAIIGEAEIPDMQDAHYFGRAENGRVVLLRSNDIMPAPTPKAAPPAPFVAGEPVQVLSTAFPGWAPVGATGLVNDISRGVVYVRMVESAHVIPFDPKDIRSLGRPTSGHYEWVLDAAHLAELPRDTVISHSMGGAIYVKDALNQWRKPGTAGSFTLDAVRSLPLGLLIVHDPRWTDGRMGNLSNRAAQ